VRRKFRTTADSRHQFPVAPNLLERDFTANAPNQVWVSDISYIPTRNGWAYLTVFIDLFSRIVTGWSLSSSLSHEMVLTALYRAIRRRQPAEGLIIHSDRGVQYACHGFTEVLKEHGFVQSMSRKGDCWDNAVAESFFSILKTELVYQTSFKNKQDALRKIFEYIEIFYNRQRMHSTLGYLTPASYEQELLRNCA
jgi:transposase InsO family protein